MKLTVYEYSKCSTCRSAVKWLKNQGHEVVSIPLWDTPPNDEELKDLIARSGLDISKFFNVLGEVYKEMGLKDKLQTMSIEDQISLLASNGRLIKRPIAVSHDKVTVGFKEPDYELHWGSGK